MLAFAALPRDDNQPKTRRGRSIRKQRSKAASAALRTGLAMAAVGALSSSSHMMGGGSFLARNVSSSDLGEVTEDIESADEQEHTIHVEGSGGRGRV